MRKASALLALNDRDGALGAAARAAALSAEDPALLRLQTELRCEASPPSLAHWTARSAADDAATAEGSCAEGRLLHGTTAAVEERSNTLGRSYQGKRAEDAAPATAARAAVAGAEVDVATARSVVVAAAAAVVPTAKAAAWGASFAKSRASRLAAPATAAWREGGLDFRFGSLRSALPQSHWSCQLVVPLALYAVLLSCGWL